METIRKTIVIVTLVVLTGCASKPMIIQKLIPEPDEAYSINGMTVHAERDNIVISVRYMDKEELYQIAKENNPYIEEDTPLLTTFKIIITNKRKNKISFNVENAVLLDGLGHQFQALTYEDFKNLYPSAIYQQSDYSFVFDRYIKDPYIVEENPKRKQASKSLFRGGKIYPHVVVEGILTFERLSDYAIDTTLILSDIKLYTEGNDTDKENKDELEKNIELKFKFKHSIERKKK